MVLLFYIAVSLLFAGVSYARQRDFLPGSAHVGAPIAWAFTTAGAAWVLGYSTPYLISTGIVVCAGMTFWVLGLQKQTKNIVTTMFLRGIFIMPLFFMLSALWSGVVVGFVAQGIVYRLPAKYAEPIFAAIIGLAIGQKLLAGF